MYGHMLQLQLPSPPGTPMNCLCGAAFSIWWMMCGSVATRAGSAGGRVARAGAVRGVRCPACRVGAVRVGRGQVGVGGGRDGEGEDRAGGADMVGMVDDVRR